MSSIRTIIFTREKPEKYDESWSASITGADCLKGYRKDDCVYIVGE
jgi:hypothetical protein